MVRYVTQRDCDRDLDPQADARQGIASQSFKAETADDSWGIRAESAEWTIICESDEDVCATNKDSVQSQ